MPSITDSLARSFFDLWQHLDPVRAGRFDPEAGLPGLASFDAETIRQHLAALRSLALAAEELDPGTLDEQIDLTLLLEALREVEHELEHERPHRTNPSFQLDRLTATLAARPGDGELLDLVPAWAETAGVPSGAFGLETGLALLAEAGRLLEDERWERVPGDRIARARAALEDLGQTLRAQARPGAEAPPDGIGEEHSDWRLHHVYSLPLGGAGALRQLAALAEAQEGELEALAARVRPGADWRDLLGGLALGPLAYTDPAAPVLEPWLAFRDPIEPEAYLRLGSAGALEPDRSRLSLRPGSPLEVALGVRYGPAGAGGWLAGRRQAPSEIRRRLATPGLVEAWGLFAEERAAAATAAPAIALLLRADLFLRTLVAAADLAVHRRQLDPALVPVRLTDRFPMPPAVALAAARRVVLAPLEAAGSVLVAREWAALARTWPGGAAALEAAVLESALPSPVLARWRHDVPG